VDVAVERLRNQRLVGKPFAAPEDVVRWLGAVQSQDFAGAKWAIGVRTRACTDAAVERAYAEGRILRTHVLRPTWHFVVPDDIRWMLALTAPRVRAVMAYYEGQFDLDGAAFRRTRKVLEAALAGGKSMTRDELSRALAARGIRASGQRLGLIMMRAEQDAVVTSGPRRGKQFTYALLDERAPAGRTLARDEALATLAGRYFASHGPALPQDFAWWSGLTVSDARRGIETATPRLASVTVDGKTYWHAPGATRAARVSHAVQLLPNYDEATVAYRDRAATLAPGVSAPFHGRPEMVMNYVVMVDGRVVGGWRRVPRKDAMIVETTLATRLDAHARKALEAAAARLQKFLGQPVTLRTRESAASRGRGK
jgi:hypothetical protein